MVAVTPEAQERGRAARRLHYHNNKQSYIDRAKASKQALRDEIAELKASTPCADCGVSYPSHVMDFDHVRGEKIGNVARLVVNNSRKQVLAEVAKCDIVCANCHRERTHRRSVDS